MSNSLIKDKISTSKASKKVELSFVNIEGLEYLKNGQLRPHGSIFHDHREQLRPLALYF